MSTLWKTESIYIFKSVRNDSIVAIENRTVLHVDTDDNTVHLDSHPISNNDDLLFGSTNSYTEIYTNYSQTLSYQLLVALS